MWGTERGSDIRFDADRTPKQKRDKLLICEASSLKERQSMSRETLELLEAARRYEYTAAQKEEHRRSFAFGNTKIENDRITRELIDREAEKLDHERDDAGRG
jgi:hypothetical protein